MSVRKVLFAGLRAVYTSWSEARFRMTLTIDCAVWPSTFGICWCGGFAFFSIVMVLLAVVTSSNVEMIINIAAVHSNVKFISSNLYELAYTIADTNTCLVIVSTTLLSHVKDFKLFTILYKIFKLTVHGKDFLFENFGLHFFKDIRDRNCWEPFRGLLNLTFRKLLS